MLQTDKIPDGGYGWVVVFGGFIVFMIFNSVSTAIGLIYTDLIDGWGVSMDELQWIGSLQSGITFGMGPIAAAMTNVIGSRLVVMAGCCFVFVGFFLSAFVTTLTVLYVTLGILPGIGFGLALTTTFIINNDYFDKRRPIANGITLCGAGIGQVVFSPLIEELLRTYGYQGTMLISSAISLHLLVTALVFVPRQKRKDIVGWEIFQQLSMLLDKPLLTSPVFILTLICNCFFQMGFYVPYAFLPESAIQSGVDTKLIPWLISVIGISSSFGRGLIGFLAVQFYRHRLITFIMTLLLCGASIAAMQFAHDFTLLCVFCMIFGASSGGAICLSFSILPDIVVISSLVNSIGMISFGQGLGTIIGTPIGGMLGTKVGIEGVVYTYGGLSFITAAVCLMVVKCLLKTRKHNDTFVVKSLLSVDFSFPEITIREERRHSVSSVDWDTVTF